MHRSLAQGLEPPGCCGNLRLASSGTGKLSQQCGGSGRLGSLGYRWSSRLAVGVTDERISVLLLYFVGSWLVPGAAVNWSRPVLARAARSAGRVAGCSENSPLGPPECLPRWDLFSALSKPKPTAERLRLAECACRRKRNLDVLLVDLLDAGYAQQGQAAGVVCELFPALLDGC